MKRLAGGMAALLILALAGAFWFRSRHQVQPRATVLLIADLEHPWEGLSQGQRAGLLTMLREAAELDPALTVLSELPSPLPAGFPLVTWTLTARRMGDELELRLVESRPAQGSSEFREKGPPAEAVRKLFRTLDLPSRPLSRLLPEDPTAFWALAELSGPFIFPELKSKQAQALLLAQRLPDCAMAHYRAAYFSLRLLIVEASSMEDAQPQCERAFQLALQALPDYPRARYQYIRFKTDIAALQEALDLALAFRDRFPHTPLSHGALAYAARNAGLLEGARRALQVRERLTGGLLADPGLAENTYLYLGDLDRFARTIEPTEGAPFSALRTFYRGYLALIRGDRAEAHRRFREAQQHPGSVNQFEQLARVYELALSERSQEALAELRRLRSERLPLRIPDGEFTFKVAEAFAFLGQPDEALESANRAFSQGFGCLQWYQQSPFLAPIRKLPRWQALMQHLQERQGYLERAFPLDRF